MIEGEWTQTELETLRALWSAGFSAAEIGRRMNRSKNSIVGKAHRLNLPSRDNPIVTGRWIAAFVADPARVDPFRADWGKFNRREMADRHGLASVSSVDSIAAKLDLEPLAVRSRVTGPTLPPLPSAAASPPAPIASAPSIRPVLLGLTPAAARIAPPQARRTVGGASECQYALNDPYPRRHGWEFCLAPSMPGSSYCREHHAICFMPLRTPHETEIARGAR